MASESKELALSIKNESKLRKLLDKGKAGSTLTRGRETGLTLVAVPLAAAVSTVLGRLDGMYGANQADGQTELHHPYAYATAAIGFATSVGASAMNAPTIARLSADVAGDAIAGPVYAASYKTGMASGLKAAAAKAAKAAKTGVQTPPPPPSPPPAT